MTSNLPGQGGVIHVQPRKPGTAARPKRNPLSGLGWVVRGGMSFASLLVLLALPEIGMRLAVPERAMPGGENRRLRDLLQPSLDPAMGWQLAPGAKTTLDGSLTLAINEGGFRGPYHSETLPTDMRRVAVLGDEQSFGPDQPDEETLAGLLESAVRERPDGPWQVLDFSVPGYDTRQEIELWRSKVALYKPKVVVLFYAADDLVPESLLRAPDFFDKSLVVRAIRRRSAEHELPSWDTDDPGPELVAEVGRAFAHDSPTWRANRDLLIEFAGEVCRADSRLVIVAVPELAGVNTRDEMLQNLYRPFTLAALSLAEQGILVVDPSSTLTEAGVRPAEFWGDKHGRRKSKLANQLIVRSLTDSETIYRQNDFVPCPTRKE